MKMKLKIADWRAEQGKLRASSFCCELRHAWLLQGSRFYWLWMKFLGWTGKQTLLAETKGNQGLTCCSRNRGKNRSAWWLKEGKVKFGWGQAEEFSKSGKFGCSMPVCIDAEFCSWAGHSRLFYLIMHLCIWTWGWMWCFMCAIRLWLR